jgi:hypothetical protein
MRTLKEMLLIFFAGLGIHRIVQDLLSLVDPEMVQNKDAGYFSVLGFMVLYFVIKYLKEKDEATSKQATN